ncbi:DnaJ C-terminal domain-containing protein [Prauserella oleivorans]|uniref:DnaJ C-terminal domain-containing protein n=1 Tax=Prauserella oleivorans TaxID=1478153 RepID=A0ABW5WCM9_9PSEU
MPSQEWVDRDFYADLGVSPDASVEEIKRAYRRLARRYHPDANPGDAEAEERFKAVSEAYTVLSDPDKRAQYDQVRRLAAAGSGNASSGPGFGAGQARGGPTGTTFVDLGDLFGVGGAGMGLRDAEALFDSLFGNATGRRGWHTAPQQSLDVEAELTLDFRTAVRGGTVTVELTDESGSRTREVRIPAGVTDGQRLRLRGQGHSAGRQGPTGDLYVRLRVLPDPVFGRSGNDLTLTLPVTVPELVLGGQVTVPTLDGTVAVRIPADSRPGRTLRVRGRGVPAPHGAGDLLLTLDVALPEQHNPAARDALRAYAEATRDFQPRRALDRPRRHAA